MSDVVSLSTREIMDILPHRYPFLLVDKILELDLENDHVKGLKNLSANEAFFQGHFPGAPIMPGVLMLEALAQTGAVFITKKLGTDKIAVLLGVKDAKFRHPAKPGDTLILDCESIHYSKNGGRVKAVASVGDKVCVSCEIAFAFVNRSQI